MKQSERRSQSGKRCQGARPVSPGGAFDGTTKKERDDNLARSGDDAVSDAVLSARRAQDETELESQVDEGLIDTFPASDPVSATYSSTAGSKERH
jgi:hypothetical protein